MFIISYDSVHRNRIRQWREKGLHRPHYSIIPCMEHNMKDPSEALRSHFSMNKTNYSISISVPNSQNNKAFRNTEQVLNGNQSDGRDKTQI